MERRRHDQKSAKIKVAQIRTTTIRIKMRKSDATTKRRCGTTSTNSMVILSIHSSRIWLTECLDSKDALMQSNGEGFIKIVKQQNEYFKHILQPGAATADAGFLVSATEFALKKAKGSGDTAAGVDIDEFVSKCVAFMRRGGPPSSADPGEAAPTRRDSQQPHHSSHRGQEESDEEDENGDALDWAVFGRQACFPSNRRPPVPSFLLGPLSVQKRVRQVTQRTQRSARNADQEPASRPQELRASDLQQSESSNALALAKKVCDRMRSIVDDGMDTVDAGMQSFEGDEEAEEAELRRLCIENRICRSADAQNGDMPVPGVLFYEFALNPRSFGQTVENLFYISFLIRDGTIGVCLDTDGLPMLFFPESTELRDMRAAKVSKHQAIVSIEWKDWEEMIELYDVRDKEPLIPHRKEQESHTVGSGGWYS